MFHKARSTKKTNNGKAMAYFVSPELTGRSTGRLPDWLTTRDADKLTGYYMLRSAQWCALLCGLNGGVGSLHAAIPHACFFATTSADSGNNR
jgi:hypothetical protein